MAVSLLLGGLAVVAVAPSAQASRGYTPPVEETQTPDGEAEVLGSVEEVPLPVEEVPAPAESDPAAEGSGGNDPAPLVPQISAAPNPASDVAPEKADSPALPRTGATILPLARAGMAVLTLGLGLVMVGRRRRAAARA